MKTVTVTSDLERRIVNFCDDELNYHINETIDPTEYESEIMAQIELLSLLGKRAMAEAYREAYFNARDDVKAEAC